MQRQVPPSSMRRSAATTGKGNRLHARQQFGVFLHGFERHFFWSDTPETEKKWQVNNARMAHLLVAGLLLPNLWYPSLPHQQIPFHDRPSHRTVLRLETDVKHECGQLSLARARWDSSRRSAEPSTTHARDWTVTEQPNATHRWINEAGGSVPSSQDSVTRAVQNLHVSDSSAAPAALPSPPPPTVEKSRSPPSLRAV